MLILKRSKNKVRHLKPLPLLFWALLMIIGGCVQTPQPAPEQKGMSQLRQVQALLILGEERLQTAEYQEANDAFRAALALKPDPVHAARGMYGLAKAENALHNYGAALSWLDKSLAADPNSPQAAEASLMAARVELKLNRPQDAASRLRMLLRRGGLAPGQRPEALEMLAKTLSGLGRPLESAQAWIDLARESAPGRAAELAPRIAELAGRGSPLQIQRMLAGARIQQVRAALTAALAQAYLNHGDLESAGEQLAKLRESPQADDWRKLTRTLESQISQAKVVNPRAVGVILPLSGSYSAYGQRVLAAVELGLDLFNPSAGGRSAPTLYIEDSRSDPAAASQAVSRLVEQRRVAAIIGPMGAAPSLAAAHRAQLLGVPMISLSRVEGVTKAGDYVFQNFTSPHQQMSAVLDEVMTKRGVTRLAVLAPRMSYGQGFAKLFSQEVSARGGEVVRIVYYDPKQTDFTAEIKKLVKLPPGKYRPGHPESPEPVIDFEALFLPDGPRRTSMVISQLAYWDVLGVYLLGTNLWHNQSLLEAGGKFLRNCIFPDTFEAGSQNPRVSRFVRDFHGAVGKEPNLLDAHGYDAALLLRRLMNQSDPPHTRQAFRQALADSQGVEGVCGQLSVGPDRQIDKPQVLFTVRGNAFVRLDQVEMVLTPAKPEEATETAGGASPGVPGQGSGEDGQASAPLGGTALPAPAATILR